MSDFFYKTLLAQAEKSPIRSDEEFYNTVLLSTKAKVISQDNKNGEELLIGLTDFSNPPLDIRRDVVGMAILKEWKIIESKYKTLSKLGRWEIGKSDMLLTSDFKELNLKYKDINGSFQIAKKELTNLIEILDDGKQF